MSIILTFFQSPETDKNPFTTPITVNVDDVREIVYPYCHQRGLTTSKFVARNVRGFIPLGYNNTSLTPYDIPALFIEPEKPNRRRSIIAPFCSVAEYEVAVHNARASDSDHVDITTIQRKNRSDFIKDVVPVIEQRERTERAHKHQSFNNKNFWPYLG